VPSGLHFKAAGGSAVSYCLSFEGIGSL